MYRHISVIKTSDNDKEVQAIYSFDDENLAIADMHNRYGVALKNTNLQATFCLVVDEKGVEIEKLSASIPDPNNKRQRYEIKPRVYWRKVVNGVEEFNISNYETKVLAKGNFHTKYAACLNNPNCTEATIACINGDGINLELKVWEREHGEPTPGQDGE